MERLAREKISAQQRLAVLKKEISSHYDNVDFSKLLPDVVPPTQNGGSTSNSFSDAITTVIDSRSEPVTTSSCSGQQNGAGDKVAIPILAKTGIPVVTQTMAPIKEVSHMQISRTYRPNFLKFKCHDKTKFSYKKNYDNSIDKLFPKNVKYNVKF